MFGYLVIGLASWFGYKYWQEHKAPPAPASGAPTMQSGGLYGVSGAMDVAKIQHILASWIVNTQDGTGSMPASDPTMLATFQQAAALVRGENGTLGNNTLMAVGDFQDWAKKNGQLDPSVKSVSNGGQLDLKTQQALVAYGTSINIA